MIPGMENQNSLAQVLLYDWKEIKLKEELECPASWGHHCIHTRSLVKEDNENLQLCTENLE